MIDSEIADVSVQDSPAEKNEKNRVEDASASTEPSRCVEFLDEPSEIHIQVEDNDVATKNVMNDDYDVPAENPETDEGTQLVKSDLPLRVVSNSCNYTLNGTSELEVQEQDESEDSSDLWNEAGSSSNSERQQRRPLKRRRLEQCSVAKSKKLRRKSGGRQSTLAAICVEKAASEMMEYLERDKLDPNVGKKLIFLGYFLTLTM